MQIDENYENITATPPSFIGQYSQYDAVQQNNPLSADESRLHTFVSYHGLILFLLS
jgi:hypothetical protein